MPCIVVVSTALLLYAINTPIISRIHGAIINPLTAAAVDKHPIHMGSYDDDDSVAMSLNLCDIFL